MSSEEKCVAIAKACGITAICDQEKGLWSLIWPDGRYCPHPEGGVSEEHAWRVCCPRFDADLEAMSEAEEQLVPSECLLYVDWIYKLVYTGAWHSWHHYQAIKASASTRAEAWLRARGLWK